LTVPRFPRHGGVLKVKNNHRSANVEERKFLARPVRQAVKRESIRHSSHGIALRYRRPIRADRISPLASDLAISTPATMMKTVPLPVRAAKIAATATLPTM